MSKKLMRKKLAMMLATLKKKRPFYTEIEYLESTGTQYIDTGIAGSDKIRMEIICQGSQANRAVAGCGETDDRFQIFAGGTYYSVRIDGAAATSTTPSLNKAQIVLDAVSQKATVNGINYSLPYTSSISSRNIHLFRVNRATLPPSDTTTPFIGKIWLFKLYDNGTLVRDFIPVLDWDMTPCMYDKVSGQLFYNAGTGSFIAGRQIHPVEYLESTGTQYIVSNLRLNGDDYSIKAKFDNIDTPNNTTAFGYQLNTANNAVQIMVIGHVNENTTGSIFLNGTQTAHAKRNMPNVMQKGLNEISITANNGTLTYTLNDASPVSYNTYTSFSPEADSNVWLFGNSRIGAGTTLEVQHQLASMKFYYFEAEQNGNKICDFIPAIDENGVGFMFDRVSHTIYDNAGTGAFKYPPVELEYLKSTGTQYIDLNFIPNNNSGFDMTGDFVQTSAAVRFGQRTAAYDRQFILISGAENRVRLDYGTGSAQASQWSPTNTGGYNRVTFDGTTKIVRIYFNNETIEEGTFTSGNFTAANSCYLFAFNNNGTALIANNMTVKTFKLYDNGNIARDLYPVFKDGQSGMWDKANNVFYSNAGTGTFSVGRVKEDEYE